jgi:flagellar basal-body rod protein FlgF
MASPDTIYLSHMVATLRSLDVIANNLANASTTGFKREAVRFEEFLAQERPEEDETDAAPTSLVRDAGLVRDLRQGPIVNTGAPLDLAVNGDGYFVIQTPSGEAYTRDGHFSLGPDRQLLTSSGAPVIGEAGAITIPLDDANLSVAADGVLSGKSGVIAKLKLVSFAHPESLTKAGANLLSTNELPRAATGRIVQGGLEGSNVEPTIEIARMIEVMRAYQATANLLTADQQDALETVQRLGKVPPA